MKKYKKLVLFISLILVCLALLFYALIKHDLIFSKVILDQYKVELLIGDNYSVAYEVKTSDKLDLKWYSENSDVATVDENGLITGISKGETRVCLNYDNKNKCIHVIVHDIPFKNIFLHHKELTLDFDDSYLFLYDYEPENATLSNLSWSSSNSDVVIVENGVIKALKEGTSTIKLESTNGVNDQCIVHVLDSPLFSFSNNNENLYQEETIEITLNDLTREYQNMVLNIYLNGQLKDSVKDKIDSYQVVINELGKWEFEAYLVYDDNLESKKIKKEYKIPSFSSVENALYKDINTGIQFDNDSKVLLFGSDFQGSDREKSIKKILEIINSQNITPGLLAFLGDYTTGGYDANSSTSGIRLLTTIFRSFSNLANTGLLFVQGNHDPEKTNYLTQSGEYDATNYGMFVINEDDFPSASALKYMPLSKEISIKLDNYLARVLSSEVHKPIFVVTHVPLHYSTRGDNPYASYIVDVLNKYGDKLDIIFMYGHNHSQDYDACLGGSINYVEKGDYLEYYRFDESKKKATKEDAPIKFTYLNAGYVGYNRNNYKVNDCSGKKIQSYNDATMTLFTINDKNIVVNRYNNQKIVITYTIPRVN